MCVRELDLPSLLDQSFRDVDPSLRASLVFMLRVSLMWNGGRGCR